MNIADDLENLKLSDNKKKFGQFFTTNYKYILQNLTILDDIENIIEPFTGNGDLLNFISNDKNIECYDIDPKKDFIIKRDTILNPPNYNNKFIITNPPYLARNKSKDKTIFDKYKYNDLYKCFIHQLIESDCLGGILIIPLNFWCSIRKNDVSLRKNFVKKFSIIHMNIFEEKVFDDTSYTICSFQFELRHDNNNNKIECTIYPTNKEFPFKLNNKNNYTIGGKIYKLPHNKNIKIERLTKNNINSEFKTNILAKCIDNNINSKICLKYVNDDEIFIDDTPKLSARSYATLIIEPKLNQEEQKELIKKFNDYLENQRDKYHSLFLTNYRESNSIARKRISFDLAFRICNYMLSSI